MAADQRKRRLSTTTNAFGYGFQDQIRAKKRDLRLPNHDFNFSTHISLKWDDNGNKVVAKEDQIGISLRHLSPFLASAPCSNSKLADVVSVPRDVFVLNDLSEVLSYEVWQSVLTEKERNFLTQFLPYGVEADEVVRALCSGGNFHFGNPLFKWGSSVCSGDLHPDAVLQHEKSFKTNKRAYYSELQQYHDNMIRNLQNLKQTCASSKDPEAEIRQISRSRRHEKTISPDANGQKYHKPDDNVGSMSESLSSIPDEKTCYSDNQELSVFRNAEIHKRMHNQDRTKDKHEKSIVHHNDIKVLARPKKSDKLQKPVLIPNDGAKYMSYVKISKKQHELVKNMRQSGSSIQSKALNRLLGALDSSNVKPYEMFVEEEQKNIHEYWLNMANKDIPNAFLNWRNLQLMKQKMMDSLWKEMEDKLRDLSKDENLVNQYYEQHPQPAPAHDKDDGKSSHGTSVDHQDNDLTIQNPSSDNYEKKSDLCTSKSESSLQNPSLNANEVIDPSSMRTRHLQNPTLNVNKESNPLSLMETESLQNHPLNVNEEFAPSSMENHSSFQRPSNVKEELESVNHPSLKASESFDPSSITNESSMEDNPSLDCKEVFTPMDLNAENNSVTTEASLSISRSGALTSATDPNDAEIPGLSSSTNIWPSVELPKSCHSHPNTLHTGSGGLSLRHQQVATPAQLIDLESDIPEEDATKDLLNRHASHLPFFNAYPPNRDRSELLHSLIKHDNYQDQQRDLFMHQNIQGGIYSDNRYSVQAPEHFSSLNVRDWSNTRLSNPMQPSQLNSGELLNHNWFATNENRSHGVWSSSNSTVFPPESMGSGTSSSDQSLYSVLTQCNIRSQTPYIPVGSTEQMIPRVNYGQEMVGGIPPMASNALPPRVSPFDYLSGGEASSNTLKNPDLGWMSVGHQPGGRLQDPSGKPFLKSWNQ